MKKYFIAAMVAIMAFSMAAFAATLNVDGGVVQAGQAPTRSSAPESGGRRHVLETEPSTVAT